MSRPYDIVLYGATGYAGRHALDHLVKHAPEGLRWAIAGRSADKLKTTLADRGAPPDTPVVVADSSDPATLDAMAAAAQVVVSTVGPFHRYGTPVVEACIRNGAHYVDITGETPWVRSLIDRLQEDAVAAGVKLVPLAGFDSVPSDIGAWMCARALQREAGQDCAEVLASFRVKVGGLNGGTWATLMSTVEDPAVGKGIRDPLLLNPPEARTADDRAATLPDRMGPHHDPDIGWTAPFVMAASNTRVVRRSAALLQAWGEGYGDGFQYNEGQGARSRFGATLGGLALGLLFAGAVFPPTRYLMKRFGPKPGHGPSEEAMAAARVRVDFVARGTGGATAKGRIEADGDASNELTAAFAVETAVSLLRGGDALPLGGERAGFLTPATAAGDVLLERLRALGQRWTVEVG